MNVMKKFSKPLLAACLAATPLLASAYEAGTWLARARLILIEPDDSSNELTLGGATLANTGVSVQNDYTLDLDFSYFFDPHWAVELLLDLSSEHDVHAAKGLRGVVNGEIITARVLPPSLIAQFHFNPKGTVQPYVGIGGNYTLFFDEDSTNRLDTALGGVSDVELDDSFGLVGQVGVDYQMGNNWLMNLDVKYIQMHTEASFDSGAGKGEINVDIDPWVIGVGIGKSFH